MATLESLNQIITSRIEQRTGLIPPNDADSFMLSSVASGLGFLTGEEFFNPRDPEGLVHYLQDARVIGVARAYAFLGYPSEEPDFLRDPVEAVIWTPHQDGAIDHAGIVYNFSKIIRDEWKGAAPPDGLGGFILEVESEKPTILLDDIYSQRSLLPESHLNAIERASKLLTVAKICVSHRQGKFTIFDEGERTIKSLRNS